MIHAYVCVYRRHLPKEKDWRKTKECAAFDQQLSEFLSEYESRFLDWGDDPAFFSAQVRMGDVRCASWGVCRRDVREKMKPGDLVVFFCGKPRVQNPRVWDYYYIGFGTVRLTVDRAQLWTDDQFVSYRKFYNVLAELRNGTLIQKETFHPYHGNWEARARAPYIIFEQKSDLTHFNVTNPMLVATYDGVHIPEKWNFRSKPLEDVLFTERGIRRRLRTSPTGFGHAKLNLLKAGDAQRKGKNLPDLRKSLLRISEEAASL